MSIKYFRFILIFCVVTLLSYTSLDAADPKIRGIQITPKSAPALESLYHQSHAVIIGISSYTKFPSLEYAVKDARAMEEKLKSLGFETTVLLEQQATKDRILKILGDELPRKVKQNDRVVIFFSGHTSTEEMADGTQMGYLVPVDAEAGNIFPTSISMDQVRDISRWLQANHVLYLIDSCFAGLGLTASGTIPPSDRNYLRKINARKAHQMLTAGGKGETAYYGEGGLGAFTVYVLKALEGLADREGKGFVTFTDLASYVKLQVYRFTATQQVPQYGNIAGEGEVVFALTGRPAEQQADTSGPDRDRQHLAREKKLAEAEGLSLAAKQAQMEELKRLDEERRKAQAALKQPLISTAIEIGRDGRFIAYENETVFDTQTKLMWAAKDNGSNINWQDAKSYCENYRGGGYVDWRMPTLDELAGLYDESITNTNPPAVGCTGSYHVTNFIHLTCCCPWASETSGSTAACFGFNNGPRNWIDQFYAGGIRVLPVRSGK